jgi:hypothetical protein
LDVVVVALVVLVTVVQIIMARDLAAAVQTLWIVVLLR